MERGSAHTSNLLCMTGLWTMTMDYDWTMTGLRKGLCSHLQLAMYDWTSAGVCCKTHTGPYKCLTAIHI